jgi:broad specificity phosphatase PhoE
LKVASTRSSKILSRKKGEKEIKGLESEEGVKERAVTWWNDTVTKITASCILIASHGAWIELLVKELLERQVVRAAHGVTVEGCPNTGMSVVEIPRGRGCGELVQYGGCQALVGGGGGSLGEQRR